MARKREAVAEYFGYAGQVETVARLAESTDVNRAADTVCWSVTKVRDAVAKTRRDVDGAQSVTATSGAAS